MSFTGIARQTTCQTRVFSIYKSAARISSEIVKHMRREAFRTPESTNDDFQDNDYNLHRQIRRLEDAHKLELQHLNRKYQSIKNQFDELEKTNQSPRDQGQELQVAHKLEVQRLNREYQSLKNLFDELNSTTQNLRDEGQEHQLKQQCSNREYQTLKNQYDELERTHRDGMTDLDCSNQENNMICSERYSLKQLLDVYKKKIQGEARISHQSSLNRPNRDTTEALNRELQAKVEKLNKDLSVIVGWFFILLTFVVGLIIPWGKLGIFAV
ncbi:hypothetical protein BDV96DRAFT_607689 [Lophiotrema nucula]|uniref:Uncharacterized protein n=1 Tax=Lophiotrema nucula TaxID=690887 RepID=A0A6A5YIJ3_9PLEO|nr:hypothetical protein BDV96DRAFT_607689 [Lophiotrema nucula]